MLPAPAFAEFDVRSVPFMRRGSRRGSLVRSPELEGKVRGETLKFGLWDCVGDDGG
jgi:hypothetical protein